MQNCHNIICESEFLKKKLISMLGKNNCLDKKILVIYYAYSKKKNKIKVNFNKEMINIGILGAVDQNRKDYSILFKLLEIDFF